MNHFNNILSACFFLFAFSNFLFAQSPQLINYQAIARNSSGQPLVSQNIGIRLSIHQSTAAGTVQYQETHNVTTNTQGLFNVQIGNGTINAGTFSAITWTDGENKFLQIELDPDGAGVEPYTDMGTQQLVSVPYALFGAETKWVKVNGSSTKVGNSGFAVIGSGNTSVGYNALLSTLGGNWNNALGREAMYSNTTGADNTAMGDIALRYNTIGVKNTAIGSEALYNSISGSGNTAIGMAALRSNTTGFSNVALGVRALQQNTTRSNLVAVGDSALFNNGTGATTMAHATKNTALGSKALYSNTIGDSNTATGSGALYSNTTGYHNTANGSNALYSNTTGYYNTANGHYALWFNTEGYNNTANGHIALLSNTEGYHNTACGKSALASNTTGAANTANGFAALFYNETGNFNTAIGQYALFEISTSSNNTAIGYRAGEHSNNASNCTMIGFQAGRDGINFSNSTALGYDAPITGNNQVNIGNTSISSIKGQVSFTTYSDQRYKTNVQTNVKGLDFILKLRPVTYQINATGLDRFLHSGYTPREKKDEQAELINQQALAQKASITYSGFLAQEVEQAAQAVGFEFSGVDKPQNERDLYGLRYAEFVVPLVKAVQEQQVMIETQSKTIEQLQQDNTFLKAELQQIKSLLLKK
ncbi:MAG: tail fiber domain-containing protein [Sphingobacteriales bacterium]|nr:MAG: tail fiber domain-containing protein [Sphingobacteriales bacterium]